MARNDVAAVLLYRSSFEQSDRIPFPIKLCFTAAYINITVKKLSKKLALGIITVYLPRLCAIVSAEQNRFYERVLVFIRDSC